VCAGVSLYLGNALVQGFRAVEGDHHIRLRIFGLDDRKSPIKEVAGATGTQILKSKKKKKSMKCKLHATPKKKGCRQMCHAKVFLE
jgi:hypothetical protein